MSAPSDGARADARKARAAQVEEGHDGRCEREYTENGFIFIDCLCSLRKAKADAWHEGRNENQAIWEAELPRLIADAKAEALREFGVRLDGHGLVAAIHDPLCPERVTHGSGDRPCHFSGAVTAYDIAESVKTYLRNEVTS